MFHLKQPLRHLAKMKMDSTAKEKIRGILVQQMGIVRTGQAGRQLWHNPIRMMPMPVFALILAVMIGGGTAFAAEGSVPGEPLYPVKVYVNEELRATLAVRAEQKANWELQRAHRRAEEALVKKQQGELDAALRARMEARIREHEAKTAKLGSELEAKGNVNAALRVRARMEKYLEAKAEVLEQLEAGEAEQKARRDALIEKKEEKEEKLKRRHELLKLKNETEVETETDIEINL